MDGARFANALAHLKCAPADITWKAGVDALSFGASKNGALAAEAVVFFNKEDVRDFEYRRKKAGHLVSKMRFISAQLEAYLEDDLWLKLAARANALAAQLARGLVARCKARKSPIRSRPMPCSRGCPMRRSRVCARRGAQFYDWEPSANGRTLVRLVLSFATPEKDVARISGYRLKPPHQREGSGRAGSARRH